VEDNERREHREREESPERKDVPGPEDSSARPNRTGVFLILCVGLSCFLLLDLFILWFFLRG